MHRANTRHAREACVHIVPCRDTTERHLPQPSSDFENREPQGKGRECDKHILVFHGSEALTEKFDKNTGPRGEAEQEVLRPDEVSPERIKAQSERSRESDR